MIEDFVRFKYDPNSDSLLDARGTAIILNFSSSGMIPFPTDDSKKKFKQVKELIDAGVKPSEIIEMKEAGVI